MSGPKFAKGDLVAINKPGNKQHGTIWKIDRISNTPVETFEKEVWMYRLRQKQPGSAPDKISYWSEEYLELAFSF